MKELYEHVRTYVRTTGQRIQETHPVIQGVAFLVVVFVLIFPFFSILTRPSLNRTVFFFPHVQNGDIQTEIRYLPEKRYASERFSQFLDELTLGPISPDLLPLYPTAVRPVRAFIRGNEAFVDLSSEAEDYLEIGVPPRVAYEVFKKNVFTNFGNVAKMNLYIGGKEVYNGSTEANAESSDKKR